MARFKWTPEIIQFVGDTYKQHSLNETVVITNEHFNLDLSWGQYKQMVKRYGLKCGRSKSELLKGRLYVLSQEQADFVAEKYKTLPIKDVHAELNKHFGTNIKLSQVKTFVKNHGIRSGRTGQWQPGQRSWLAGTKGVMKPNRASFKKGHRPHTWVPVGTIRESSIDGYLKIKVANPNEWQFLHRYIWEQHHGPVPDGHFVAFIDGNRKNCDISNLKLRSREQSAVRNRWTPPDLAPELLPLADTIADLRIAASAAKRAMEESRRAQQ